MARIWALTAGFVAAMLIVLLAGPLGGTQTMLSASIPIGSGIAAVYLTGTGHLLARGAWLIAGVLAAALGFVAGGLMLPDTTIGLCIGGIIPIVLLAFMTMWTKRQSDFLAGVLGAGSMSGVYGLRFFQDPQSMNVSLPIALGQCLFPLALGFIAGVVVHTFVPDDAQREAVEAAEQIASDAAR